MKPGRGTCSTCGRDLVQTAERTYHPAAVMPPEELCPDLLPIAGTDHPSFDVPGDRFIPAPEASTCSCGEAHDVITARSLGMVCARCEAHTGNNNQGHYWAHCKVTRTIRDFHFCCPGDCSLPPPT